MEITKNQFRLLMQQKQAADAALTQVKACQIAAAQAEAHYQEVVKMQTATISCISADGGGSEVAIGDQVRFEDKDGKYFLMIQHPMERIDH